MPRRSIERPDKAHRKGEIYTRLDGVQEVRPGDTLVVRRRPLKDETMPVSDVNAKGDVYVRPGPGQAPIPAKHLTVLSRDKGPMWGSEG